MAQFPDFPHLSRLDRAFQKQLCLTPRQVRGIWSKLGRIIPPLDSAIRGGIGFPKISGKNITFEKVVDQTTYTLGPSFGWLAFLAHVVARFPGWKKRPFWVDSGLFLSSLNRFLGTSKKNQNFANVNWNPWNSPSKNALPFPNSMCSPRGMGTWSRVLPYLGPFLVSIFWCFQCFQNIAEMERMFWTTTMEQASPQLAQIMTILWWHCPKHGLPCTILTQLLSFIFGNRYFPDYPENVAESKEIIGRGIKLLRYSIIPYKPPGPAVHLAPKLAKHTYTHKHTKLFIYTHDFIQIIL